MRVAFVTNFCPHYRVRTFEIFSQYYDIDYYFFSAGNDWYWQQQNGVHSGNFHYEYLHGVSIGRTRITPDLPFKLFGGSYDAYIKCINGRFALPITYLVSRLRKKPFILWTGIWMRLQTPGHLLMFPITRFIYRHADALVVYGEHVKKYLLSEGVREEHIFVTSHAVDNDAHSRLVGEEEKIAIIQNLNIPQGKMIILYLGRLEKAKGIHFLIDAFASLNRDDSILVFAGDGAHRNPLVNRAIEVGIIDRVRFAGYVKPEQTTSYYAVAYVCVLPSITTKTFKEPWGLVVNEAFNQGVPVIATDAVGAAAGGLVQDRLNGYIVKEGSADDLASALRMLLDNPQLRETMGKNARTIIAKWDNEHMVLGFRRALDYAFEKQSATSRKFVR